VKNSNVISRAHARVVGISPFVFALIAFGAFSVNATAATITPTTFTDPPISGAGISVNTGNGIITGGAGNGLISLRSAVSATNAHSGWTISLGVGTYQLSIAPVMSGTSGSGNFHKAAYDSGTGLNTNGSLDITAAVTISGVSAAQTIIDGGGPNANEASPTHDLLMSINPYIISLDQAAAPNSFATTLSNLTLQHGDNPSDDGTLGFSAGGAVYWEAGWNHMALGTGSLTLDSVSILHNKARGAGAGMVLWNGGTVTITNSTISNNTVNGAGVGGADGAGIIATQPAPSGVVTITNTTFDSNSCIPNAGAGGGGGAIEVVGAAQTYAVTIHGGSITNNSAPAGAGILGASGPLNITIDQGTLITGNTATAGPGGGIFVPAAITVKAGTVISGNSATAQGGGAVLGAGSTITQSSIINNASGIAGGGVYVFNGPDASTNTAAVALPYDRIFGNTAPAGGSQVDSANDLNGFNDVWLGSNVPAASTIIGASNAVAISSIGPDAYHSTTTPAVTATHNAFATGQGLEISGVASGPYGGFAGCYTPFWATPPSAFAGITVTGTNSFTMCSALATPGATAPASSGGQANQSAQIISATESGSTVTITVTQGNAFGVDMPHKLVVGQVVRIQGITAAAGYNGEFVVTSIPSTPSHPGTTFTYTAAVTGMPASGATGVAIPLVFDNITTATESGSTVTLTLNDTAANYGFALGNLVSIAGVGGNNTGTYNGAAVLTGVSGSTVTFNSPNTGLASASHGNITKLADSILQFKVSASPNLIRIGDTSTVTASFLSDSANNVISPSNLGLVIGLPVTWAAGGANANLSGQQATVQNTGTATATFSATTGGLYNPSALVDNPPALSALVTVLFPPSISKSFNATHIPVGGTSTLTFTITNPNTTHGLAGLAFTDPLPSGLAVANTPNASTTCTGGSVTAAASSGTISLSGGSLSFNAAGTLTCTVSVDVKGLADGVQNNTTGHVSATDLGGMTGNTANASITVINPPTIAKSFTPNSIPFGATSTLTLTVSNSNTVETLNGVAFTDNLPAGMTVASPSNLSSTCSGSATTPTTSKVTLSGAALAPGSSCQVSLSVAAAPPATYNNSVSVTSTDFGGLTGNTANASLTVTKANTTTALASSSNPSAFGKSVTFTATVSDSSAGSTAVPTGTVQFVVDGVNFGSPVTLTGATSTTATATSGATATLSVATSPHTVTASYVNSDGNFNNSSGTLSGGQVITAAATLTAVTSTVNPSVFGQSVKFTATVTDNSAGSTAVPTGTVQFVVDGVNFGSAVTLTGATSTSSTAQSQATTTLSVSGSPHTVTANYVNTDANFSNSSGSLSGGQSVTAANTSTAVTSSLNPSVFGQSVQFTATVTDTSAGSTAVPTGSVQFVVDGSNFGSPVSLTGASSNSSTAQSQATTTLTVAGSPHSVSANYVNADGNFSNSNGSLSGGQTVTKVITTTTLTPSQATITLGDTVTLTATVAAGSNTALGIVTFYDGSTPLGSAALNGVAGNDQAFLTTSLLSAAGSAHSIKATFQATTAFAASSSSVISETVNRRTSSTGVVMSPTAVVVGQSSTATVTVTDSSPSVPPGTADTFAATGAPATGRTGFTATLFGDGLVLVAGGTDANNNVLNSAEFYSASGAAFTATGNLNGARTGAVAVLLPSGQVLIAGGSSDGTATGALNTAELFDPSTGTFTATSHTLNAARVGASAMLLNSGKVLLAGGANSGGVLNSAELYDATTDTFTATGTLNAARTGASATLLGNGKVLIAGGSSDGTANGALNSAEVFNPAGAGTFASVTGANPTLGAARWQGEAARLLSGKVLVAGGMNSGGAQTSADLYDPVADSFTVTAEAMSQARAGGTAVALPNGMVLLADGTTSQIVDLYDADSDQFNTTGSLQQSDSGLQSVLLNNGDVLVVGLTTAGSPASDAQLYAPTFNPLGSVAVTSSEPTDVIGTCVLSPSTSADSTCSATITPANVASSPHTITGTYTADAVHAGSNNTAGLTTNKSDTTTPSVTSSANPSAYGQLVTFTATVAPVAPGSGSPTGTVTFLDGGSPIGTGSVSGGVATFATSTLSAGDHTITTSYGGDSNFNGSTGSLTGNPQVVNPSDSTTDVTTTVNPSVFGQSVTFTATVAPVAPGSGSPSGTVNFLDGGTPIGSGTLSGGIATLTTSALTVGDHTITTDYAGDGNFNGSSGSLTGNPQVVTAADTSTLVVSSVNPSAFGQSVTFTATVTDSSAGSSAAPTGSVQFLVDGVNFGAPVALTPASSTSSAASSSATSTLSVAGSAHTVSANYINADGNFNSIAGALAGGQVITAATTATTVASSANPSVYGQSVTFTATVTDGSAGSTAAPTGAVQFVVDGVNFGSPVALTPASSNSSSAGSSATSTLSIPGSPHSVTANYVNADGNFANSTGSLAGGQTVTVASTATTVISSSNPAVFGESVTFTATVTDSSAGSAAAPTGAVQFIVDGVNLGSPVTLTGASANSSTASSPATSSLSIAGSPHSVMANYVNADGNFSNSSDSLSQTVNQAASAAVTQVTPPGPITEGGSVQLTAIVSAAAPGSGTPTGSVMFLDGANPLGSAPLSGGTASIMTSALTSGSHSFTTSYAGDSNFKGTTSPATVLSVTPATRTITATAGANGSITPSTQFVVDGNTASFTVTPQNGFTAMITTTCPEGLGTLDNNIYTTRAISQDCSVNATFASASGTLTLTLSDNRSFVHYGGFIDYIVTLNNSSGSDATGLTISGIETSPSSDLDTAFGHWQCFGDAAECLPTGTGPFLDNNVTVPANTTVAWMVSIPKRAIPPDGFATYTVTVSGITPTLMQVDTDYFVIFRDGFNVANGDGTGYPSPVAAGAVNWDGSALAFSPMTIASGVIQTVLQAQAPDRSGFRIEQIVLAGQDWLRVVTVNQSAAEQRSDWVNVQPTASLLLSAACAQGKCELILVGAAAELDVPIAAATSWDVNIENPSQ
jgi:hypothetical protein